MDQEEVQAMKTQTPEPMNFEQLQRKQSDALAKVIVNTGMAVFTGLGSLLLVMKAGAHIKELSGPLYLFAAAVPAGYCLMHLHFTNRFIQRDRDLRAELQSRFR